MASGSSFNPGTWKKAAPGVAVVIGVAGASAGAGWWNPGGTFGPSNPSTATANIWVNTSAGGSPSRSGSLVAYDSTHAYGTFASACAAASGGDVIGVNAGSYGLQTITRSDCNPASTVTFKSFNAHAVVLANPGGKALQLGGPGGNGTADSNIAPNHLTFDGIDFQGRLSWTSHGTTANVQNLAFTRYHIWDTASNTGFQMASCFKAQTCSFTNGEIGPTCCNTWAWGGAEQGSTDTSGADPTGSNITFSNNYVHDIYGRCADMPSSVSTTYGCSAVGYNDHNESTTLSAAITDTSATTISLTIGASFPPAGSGNYYIKIDSEVMHVTGGQGTNTLTVARNTVDGSCTGSSGGAATHLNGATVSVLDDCYLHVDGIHMYAGNVVTINYNIFSRAAANGCGGVLYLEGNGGGFGTFQNVTVQGNFIGTGDAASPCTTIGTIGKGTATFGGFLHLYYNTWLADTGGISLSMTNLNGAAAPGFDLKIVGNIFDGSGGGGTLASCQLTLSDASVVTPVWLNNTFHASSSTCGGGTNLLTTPTLVSSSPASQDLHLSGAQSAINGGESTYCPATDIDGASRPQGAACDIGADENS